MWHSNSNHRTTAWMMDLRHHHLLFFSCTTRHIDHYYIKGVVLYSYLFSYSYTLEIQSLGSQKGRKKKH
jgi:hypothetical protein